MRAKEREGGREGGRERERERVLLETKKLVAKHGLRATIEDFLNPPGTLPYAYS